MLNFKRSDSAGKSNELPAGQTVQAEGTGFLASRLTDVTLKQDFFCGE